MKTKLFVVMLFTTFLSYNASATVNIGGTRVVYDGTKKEVSLSVSNPDASPYLIQSTIENLDKGSEKTPFIITPPLYRLDGGKENLMRIILAGNVSQDKESMYWLRIKAIPSAPREKNTLQIAVATNIKLIYRPATLKGIKVEQESQKLVWQIAGSQLQVKNPTPCYINFNEINVAGKKLPDVSYVAPGSTASFPLPANVHSGRIQYTVINDVGAISQSQSVNN